MVTLDFVPDRGDIVWLQFNPQAGYEQTGQRPAMAVSPKAYNAKVRFALFCPITSKIKGYPFEVRLPEELPVTGVILADQVKSLDWQARQASFVCKAPAEVVAETLAKIHVLLE